MGSTLRATPVCCRTGGTVHNVTDILHVRRGYDNMALGDDNLLILKSEAA